MKRVFSFLLLLIVLFLIVEFVVTRLTKGYVVNYNIYASDKNIKIKETYSKKMDNIYDIELSVGDNNFYYMIKNNFNKQKRIIKDILYFEDNGDICIYPILKDNTGTYLECIRNNELYTASVFPNSSLVVKALNDISASGYNVPLTEINKTYDNNNLIADINDDTIIIWDYKNIKLITSEDYKAISVLDFDKFDNKLGVLVGKYYIVPVYTNSKVLEFDKVKLINIETGKEEYIKLKQTLSSSTYVNGVVNNKLYYTDADSLNQVEINPYNNSSRLVGSIELGGLMYEGSWKDRNIYDFKKEIKYTEDLSSIKEYKYKDLIYSNAAYYFYDESGNVYQVFKNHPDKKILLFKAPELSNFRVVDNDLYYVIGDSLYRYNNVTGVVKVLINKDLLYNTNNRIYIYRKSS